MPIFDDQQSYEQVMLILRRHYLILLGILLRFLFLGILPIVGYIFLKRFLLFSDVTATILKFLISIYYLFFVYGLFYMFADYLLDVWMVTDHRILDIKQDGLFRRDVAETRLSNIQDIKVTTMGYLQTFFDFGNVVIQTAGTEPEFEFQQVPHPTRVKDIILKLFDDFMRTHIGGREIHEDTLPQ